jgi:hypothetical protein
MCIADENLLDAILLVSTEVQFPKERGWLASVPIIIDNHK